ncbi:MAG: ribosome maturation factor RimP [Candidatus Latescibacterota bacterium]
MSPPLTRGNRPITPDPAREALRERLSQLIEPVVADHDAELVDIELVGVPNNRTVRLLVHRDPGASVDLCEAISREVADVLDVEDPVPGRYRLEVTSPGLRRPLRTDADYRRAQGRRLKVVLRSGRTLYGRLQDWDCTHVRLAIEADDQAVERAEIARATIEADL